MACLATGVAAGAAVSTYYWGFPLARPAVPEFATATRVEALAAVRAVAGANGCTLAVDPDLRLDAAAEYARDFPELRGLVALRARGLLTDATPAPAWLDAPALYDAVRAAGVLVTPPPGYGDAGCFGGHVVEVALPSGETRVVVVAGGPAVAHDHHPYYEVVFRRTGTQLTLDRTRVAYFATAGLDGVEWPLLHAAFVAAIAAALALAHAVRAVLAWLGR